jgi:hypothetical protein
MGYLIEASRGGSDLLYHYEDYGRHQAHGRTGASSPGLGFGSLQCVFYKNLHSHERLKSVKQLSK